MAAMVKISNHVPPIQALKVGRELMSPFLLRLEPWCRPLIPLLVPFVVAAVVLVPAPGAVVRPKRLPNMAMAKSNEREKAFLQTWWRIRPERQKRSPKGDGKENARVDRDGMKNMAILNSLYSVPCFELWVTAVVNSTFIMR
jgi:hypothetical protein